VGLVIRRYDPDPAALLSALAGRVDSIERDLRGATGDLAALGRGVADLTAEIRRLATLTPTAAGFGPQDGAGNGADAGAEDGTEASPGQPDWLAIQDAETARLWLVELHRWVEQVLAGHGLTIPAACWPLHPDVVALLLALEVERETAYAGDRPTPVTEWLTRWLPTTAARIDTALAGCVAERGHHHAGAVYDATGLDPASIATWWATDRTTPAPDAFALTQLN
jgi:hypothetical protein